MPTRKNFKERRLERQEEAKARQELFDALSESEKALRRSKKKEKK